MRGTLRARTAVGFEAEDRQTDRRAVNRTNPVDEIDGPREDAIVSSEELVAGQGACGVYAAAQGKHRLTQTGSKRGVPVPDNGVAASTTVAPCSGKSEPPP